MFPAAVSESTGITVLFRIIIVFNQGSAGINSNNMSLH
jgi:hypothetical protein